MILLDTDHISVLQRQSSVGERLANRLDGCGELPATSVITLEEQSRSWIAELGRRRDVADQVVPYRSLLDMFAFFEEWEILPFSFDAVSVFKSMRANRVRIATTDLKIASIAITSDLVLLTANSRDFERVPGLQFDNWIS
ncbi:MAG: type II toxin-antitoxin system VapC family toxin [Pirellulaceae bacterium]|nr:type II toxin-antitoxin system VapC family toxin [Pirellulaceae bacterium]